jgi:hypothetical protein
MFLNLKDIFLSISQLNTNKKTDMLRMNFENINPAKNRSEQKR